MKNQKLIRFLQSLILLPMVTSSVQLGSPKDMPSTPKIARSAQEIVLSEKPNTLAELLLAYDKKEEEAEAAKMLAAEGEAIDSYFRKYKMPLEGTGLKMAEEAEKNGLDWRLLPAISVIESTGGKFACKKSANSFFGWGSCKIGFESKAKAIEVVAWNLGGNNPNTDHHYAGKDTKAILQKYNPPSIVPLYAAKVMKVMDAIGAKELVLETETKFSNELSLLK